MISITKIRCEECGGKCVNDLVRGEIYCDVCGLVRDPLHPMGLTLESLIGHVKHIGLLEAAGNIRVVGTMFGLKKARMEVATLEAGIC